VWQNLEFINVAASGTKCYDCTGRVLEQNYNLLKSDSLFFTNLMH